jgi:acyl dehydratase
MSDRSTVSSEAPVEKAPKGISARITDEDIERARRQIGIPQYERNAVFNTVATSDTISHFAFGIGDDNPLFHDPEYGKASRWRGQIATPLYLTTTGIDETPRPAPELKQLFRGLFNGVGRYYSGTSWEWFRPVCPNDLVYRQYSTYDVQVKDNSAFTGGRTVIDRYEYLYADRLGLPFAHRIDSFVNAERGASFEKGQLRNVKRQTFTPDDIARIDAMYENEKRRGREKRYWEDIDIGETVDPVVKGPLAVTDIVGFHIGWGFGQFYGAGPLKFAYQHRKRVRAFYVEDPFGFPDVVQRLHWDPARAQDLGLPAPYDYGTMRSNWLAHMLTNWIGDDGWLWKLDVEIRGFNFLGDVTICSGEVVAKRREGLHCVLDLVVRGTNQRGEVTAPGTATVILPSREEGPVILPSAPDVIVRSAAAMIARGADRLREPAPG